MPKTPERIRTDDLGWSLGVLLRGYRDAVRGALDDIPHGARGYETLCAVVGGEHPSQLALAQHLGIDRTVMTYLVDDLVEADLVERRPNPADRRQRQVVATAAGRRLVAVRCAQVAEAEAELLQGLDPAEREEFLRLSRKAAHVVGGVDPGEVCEVVAGEEEVRGAPSRRRNVRRAR
jgi:DNA-binding MarR family transcriptional regulator